ncbi:MAG: trypsin-like peptidase domain-containing protein [Oscillospiraceae bacterium]|nr:trypsin-like peptidase domain-containing protein [Oscillospiraceae bacterium]
METAASIVIINGKEYDISTYREELVFFDCQQLSDEDIKKLPLFKGLKGLSFNIFEKEADLSPLSELKNLETLCISGHCTDLGFLAGMTNLKELMLDYIPNVCPKNIPENTVRILQLFDTKYPDMNWIKKFDRLEMLKMTEVDSGDLSGIGEIQTLQDIEINLESHMTPDCSFLKSLTNLKVFSYSAFYENEYPKNIEAISHCRSLERLEIYSDVRDLEFCRGLKNLREFDLYPCSISKLRYDLIPLLSLENPEKLSLDCETDESVYTELRRKFPKCEIALRGERTAGLSFYKLIDKLPDFLKQSENSMFIRAIGCCDNYEDSIKQLDREMTAFCRRVTEFPPLANSADITAAVDKYQSVMEGNFPDKKFAEALKSVLDLEKSANANYNSTIEKNLAASLIYWCSALLGAPTEGRGKFICSGNIRLKEYLFCVLAFRYGYDVMILLPGGDLSLPSGLLDISHTVNLGECRNTAVPQYSQENDPAENAYENYHVNLNHPKRSPIGSQQAAARITGNIYANNQNGQGGHSNLPGNSSGNYHVNLNHPKRRPLSSQQDNTAPKNTPSHTDPRQERLNIPADMSRQSVAQYAAAQQVPASRRELTFEELAQLAESVVMIETEDSLGHVTGSGSGVVIDSRGYILTNCHVACQSKAYRIRMENDDCIYRTDRLLKYHPDNDLAILRIDRPMKPLKIYDGQKELVRGQKVVAIGSPHGLFNSVSDGIIAGLRTISDVDMIQFTAPISGGSSGGALLNMYGEVIGICTATLRDSQNINIAVSYKQLIPFCQGFISESGE